MKHNLFIAYWPAAFACLLLWGQCSPSGGTEKHQGSRRNVVDVHDRIKEIRIDDPLIGLYAMVYIMNECLIINDYQSSDKFIHLFDKNTFEYLTGTATFGQGPNEITRIGHIATDEAHRKFYVTDHGKQRIYSFDLDSVLADPSYTPHVKMALNDTKYPDRYLYVNDTLCYGIIIEPVGNSDFKPSAGKWNMTTGEITLMKYEHPDIEKRRVAMTVSMEHGIYAECYSNHDLITVGSLDGELKYNLYGPKWDTRKQNRISFYGAPLFCGDKLVALYFDWQDTFIQDRARGVVSNLPTQFIVFDLEGNYLKTLETGYKIARICYDKESNRILMSLDDDIQFAYLDLDGVI
jgi:hypothetical protein